MILSISIDSRLRYSLLKQAIFVRNEAAAAAENAKSIARKHQKKREKKGRMLLINF
jgi:hypothetical protein